ncbi:MAG: DUF4168 domain-containing protein [Cyanobacteriota bacterium]|nr:DUF4168 domain-containing protein [Cyanobacteriota bacterium]
MLKSLLLRSLAGSFVFLSLGSFPAYSQTISSLPSFSIAQAASSEVTTDELRKFAEAYKQLRAIDAEAEQRMAQIVEQHGLTPQRFVEIGRSQEGGDSGSSAQVTPEEQANFDKALVEVREVLQDTETRKYEAVQSQGLGVERFKEIITALQQSPELQEQVKQMLQN